ncbi:hypothetical protein HA402_008681 [Bradysia odoriphaga]|nr:hypothetical protein HA402_008681 [Bradysia odoriphaga]
MKSTIFIVLLALCHTSLGKPQDAQQVYKISAEIDDESGSGVKVSESISGDGLSKIDCDCNKSKPKITYGPEQIVKGKPETYIHHQPKIIVRQPPTHVRIEHPPTVIQPSTIVFRRHGKTIRRPVIYQHLPQDVQVRPVYVKVVKPIEKKVIIENKLKQAQIINSNDDALEYETSYGGRTYSGSFDEQQSVDIQKSNKAQAKIQADEYDTTYGGGRTYSGSYAEQESVGIQKSNKAQAKVETSEYDTLYGGGRTYSGSYDEEQQEAIDIQNSKQVQVNEYSNEYDGHSYGGSYEEQQQESLGYQKSNKVQANC